MDQPVHHHPQDKQVGEIDKRRHGIFRDDRKAVLVQTT